jgi:hypothetical protein
MMTRGRILVPVAVVTAEPCAKTNDDTNIERSI